MEKDLKVRKQETIRLLEEIKEDVGTYTAKELRDFNWDGLEISHEFLNRLEDLKNTVFEDN